MGAGPQGLKRNGSQESDILPDQTSLVVALNPLP